MLINYRFNDSTSAFAWYAVRTRSRQEKVAASILEAFGVPYFLPMKSEIRQWSDRKQRVTVPLFSGYLFVRINPHKDSRLQVMRVPGVAGFVGNQNGPLPVPDQQIEDIRLVLERRVECTVLPLLDEGDRVRVVRGALAGVEGRIVRSNLSSRLVISIELIHKSVVISVAREDVDLLEPCAA
jgi:transcription antitermination factor NusG